MRQLVGGCSLRCLEGGLQHCHQDLCKELGHFLKNKTKYKPANIMEISSELLAYAKGSWCLDPDFEINVACAIVTKKNH